MLVLTVFDPFVALKVNEIPPSVSEYHDFRNVQCQHAACIDNNFGSATPTYEPAIQPS